jgi:hypothetical protein
MCTIQEDWIYFDPKMDWLIAEKNPIEDWARKIKKWGRVFWCDYAKRWCSYIYDA